MKTDSYTRPLRCRPFWSIYSNIGKRLPRPVFWKEISPLSMAGVALATLSLLSLPTDSRGDPWLDVVEVELPDRAGLGCVDMVAVPRKGGGTAKLLEAGWIHTRCDFGTPYVPCDYWAPGISVIEGLNGSELKRTNQKYTTLWSETSTAISTSDPPFVAWLGNSDELGSAGALEILHGLNLQERILREFAHPDIDVPRMRIVDSIGPEDFTFVLSGYGYQGYYHSSSDVPIWTRSDYPYLSVEPVKTSGDQTVLAASSGQEIKILDTYTGEELHSFEFGRSRNLMSARLIPGESEQLVALGTEFEYPFPPDSDYGTLIALDIESGTIVWEFTDLAIRGAEVHDLDGDGIDEIFVVHTLDEDTLGAAWWDAYGNVLSSGTLEINTSPMAIGIQDFLESGEPEILISTDCQSGIEVVSSDLSSQLVSENVLSSDFSHFRIWTSDSGKEYIYSIAEVLDSPGSSGSTDTANVLRASDSATGELLLHVPLTLPPDFEMKDFAVQSDPATGDPSVFAVGIDDLTPFILRINPQTQEIEEQRGFLGLYAYMLTAVEVADFSGDGNQEILVTSSPAPSFADPKSGVRYHLVDPDSLQMTWSSESIIDGRSSRPALLDTLKSANDMVEFLLVTLPGERSQMVRMDDHVAAFTLDGPIGDASFVRDEEGRDLIAIHQGDPVNLLQFYDVATGDLVQESVLETEVTAITRQRPESLLLASDERLYRYSLQSMEITSISRRIGPGTGFSAGFKPSSEDEGRMLIGNHVGIFAVRMPPSEILFQDGFDDS